jgi:hypothetical protein
MSDQTGAAITSMEPGKRGMRAYFDVDDINAGAARVQEARRRTSRARWPAWAGSRSAETPKGTSSACGRTTRPPSFDRLRRFRRAYLPRT